MRSNGTHSALDSVPRLVLSGLPLTNPTVGLGVHTLRLIRGLLRSTAAPPFRVLVPTWLRGGALGIPDSVLVRFGNPRRVPHPLVEHMLLSAQLATSVKRRFPGAVFHSPAPFWSWQRPARTVVTLHDCIYRHFPLYEGRLRVRRWLNRAAERYAGNASAVLTVSRFSARDLAETTGIPTAKIHVIYNWPGEDYKTVDQLGQGPKRVRAKFALPERFWLYLGGYDYRKNVETLIDAYALTCRQATCPPLVLAGRLPASVRLPFSDVGEKIRATGLGEARIRAMGLVDEEDLPALYAAAELFVYPSLYEGFGLPPLEAMAAGTPVLVSNTSSLPEVVPRRECQFDPRSVRALAQKLEAAARDASQFQCARRVEFSEQHAIARYLELLARIA